jgi:hypothetical protein
MHHLDYLVVVKGKDVGIFAVHLMVSLKILAWEREEVLFSKVL